MLSGFGARCCDLIRRVKMSKERPLPYAVRRAEKHELPRIAALENALNRSITYCYAVEGAYPQSLEELERGYGLAYNKDAYIVSYDAFASNIMPNIQVLRKGETQP